jgi:hypothetical protein
MLSPHHGGFRSILDPLIVVGPGDPDVNEDLPAIEVAPPEPIFRSPPDT